MVKTIVSGVVAATALLVLLGLGWYKHGSSWLDPRIIRSPALDRHPIIGDVTFYTKSILNLLEMRTPPDENYELRRIEKRESSILRGASQYKEGDVVEITHNRVLAPLKVVAIHSISDGLHTKYYDDDTDDFVADYYSSGIGYDLVRASDGFKVNQMPESSIRHYMPYPIGTEALCNIGDVGKGNEDVKTCIIQDYIPMESEETTPNVETILQNQYMVSVQQGSMDGEYHTTLPVWKVQRINDVHIDDMDIIEEETQIMPNR